MCDFFGELKKSLKKVEKKVEKIKKRKEKSISFICATFLQHF